MKRSYYLIAAGALTAAVAGTVFFGGHKKKPATAEPLAAEPPLAAPEEPGSLPPLPEAKQASLPPIAAPADTPLLIPAANAAATAPTAGPGDLPVAISLPPAPEAPSGASVPGAGPSALLPSAPVVPPTPTLPPDSAPAKLPVPPIAVGTAGAAPAIPVAPVPPVPAMPASPSELLSATGPAAVVALPAQARYLVLRGRVPEGKAGKLLVELTASKLVAIDGIASPDKAKERDAWVVRQGTIVRNLPKVEVIFAGKTKEDVYHFMRDRVEKTDATARLVVARWCMFNGMREQALAEGREVLRIQPDNRAAQELVRSLEESLRQFPADGSPAASRPAGQAAPVVEGEVDVTPEAATTFAIRVQPILANLCVECHARPDYSGTFKLAKVEGYEASPKTTQTNLRAVAGQLRKADPGSSPLLVKAIVAHGGLRQPSFQTRQAPGYRILESWAAVAVGPVVATGNPMAGTLPTAVQPIGGSESPTLPTPPPASGLPPVESVPALPPIIGVPTFPAPLPSGPTPSNPPPVVTIPPVLPTPPVMTPMVPTQPPVVPMSVLPTVPAVPAASGSQFGTSVPPVPSKPSAARDEFDPTPFNIRK